MATRIALAAAARTLRGLADQATSRTMRERIEQLAATAGAAEAGAQELSLGDVTNALFPGDENPVERFRGFRRSLHVLAHELDVDLACKVDGHKHAAAPARRCWFTGTDDSARQLEILSEAATSPAVGAVEVPSRARRAVRVCIDGIHGRHAATLASKLHALLAIDRELDVEVSDTTALAGEPTEEVRAERLGRADLVVALLSPGYLAARRRGDLGSAIVVPVAMEYLGDGADLRGFHNPFALEGAPYVGCRRADLFAAGLRDQIAGRLVRGAEPNVRQEMLGESREWARLVPDDEGPIVDARALRTQLDRRPPSGAVDATVDVQDYLRSWADSADERPYLVIFGEYGMGKTTAAQVFTRGLLERRRNGAGTARLPIYLDLRRLGDVKHREPALEAILDDLLRRVWQAGGQQAAPTAAEVIEQVQRQRAVVIFDGLDEVLVHLRETQGQALLRELWKILPPDILADPHQRDSAGRVVLTCRTHFFRTLRDQHTYFRGEDRETVGAHSYAALHLLPFTADQVRAYLEHRQPAGDSAAVERAVALIRDVHDLTELVRRPFNLRLVADQLAALERRIASGERVDTAALYAELVATWLDRDQGKHQLPPRHKVRLMGELAAELWRNGRRSLPIDRLEEWLECRLDSDDELGRWFRLQRADLAVIAEDLRTATFVVRPGGDEFEFAHTSLLEYFLALHLARSLAQGEHEAWALPMPSRETVDFLAEIIALGDIEASREGLRQLRAPYRAQASELAFIYCVRALERGGPGIALAGFDLEGARLRGLVITGPPGRPMLRLADTQLARADLVGAQLRRVRVERCDLGGAKLQRAELQDCVLDRVRFDKADLSGLIVRGCSLVGLDLRTAHAARTQWLGCTSEATCWPESEAHLFAGPVHDGERVPRPTYDDASLAPFAGHSGWVRSIAWSPTGAHIASAHDDGSARIWDPVTGHQLQHLAGHTDRVNSVAWSPDANRLASAGGDGSARIWDPATGEQVNRLTGHTSWVSSVTWSPDGSQLATAGNDGSVRIWDSATGAQLHHLTGHAGWVHCVVWSPDTTQIATSGEDGSVRTWDPATGEQLNLLFNRFDRVKSLAWSPDATKLAAAGGDGSVGIWNPATGEQVRHIAGHTDRVNTVAWSPDATRLATAGSDGTVRVWNLATGEQLQHINSQASWVHSVAWSPGSDRLASAGGDGGVRVWDPGTGEQLRHLSGHTSWVSSVAWSPDAIQLASASGDGGIRIWDPATGEQQHHLTGHTSWVSSVAWSPDAAQLASAGNDASVRVWNPATGNQVQLLEHTARVNAIAWSPDATKLVTAGNDGSVRIWDPATGMPLQDISGHSSRVKGVAWCPNTTRLATAGSDGSVCIWDPATGERLQRMEHTRGVLSVAWSPDATRIATSGSEGSVFVWDPGTGERLQHITTHTSRVHCVAWSPDAAELASADEDGSVRIWDPATGEQLQQIMGHTRGVLSVAWAADVGLLASASNDGTVRVWNPGTGEPRVAIHIFADDDHAALVGDHVTSCSDGAWRWLGWLAPSPITGRLTRYPAEVFGPLPIQAGTPEPAAG